jgi:phage-related protein
LARRAADASICDGRVLHRPACRSRPLLGEPYTRQLDGKLRELRFHLQRGAVRLTYWIAPGRRIVLLTVFQKSRMREEREIDRARRRCEVEEHTVDEEDGR